MLASASAFRQACVLHAAVRWRAWRGFAWVARRRRGPHPRSSFVLGRTIHFVLPVPAHFVYTGLSSAHARQTVPCSCALHACDGHFALGGLTTAGSLALKRSAVGRCQQLPAVRTPRA